MANRLLWGEELEFGSLGWEEDLLFTANPFALFEFITRCVITCNFIF